MEAYVLRFSLSMLTRDDISPSKKLINCDIKYCKEERLRCLSSQQDMENPSNFWKTYLVITCFDPSPLLRKASLSST